MTVTFDAPPDPTQATTLANYQYPGLTLSGTPTLLGTTVTLATSGQSAGTYTDPALASPAPSDGEALTVASADFTGTPAPPRRSRTSR